MSKTSNPRFLPTNTPAQSALASARNVKGSTQKAQLVLNLIRGKNAAKAINDLEFSHKKLADVTRKVLLSAVANAENNHQLNVDKLVVVHAYTDKGLVMKRFHARARGRGARILKPFCHITIVLAEQEPVAKPEKKAAPKVADKSADKSVAKPATKAPKAKVEQTAPVETSAAAAPAEA